MNKANIQIEYRAINSLSYVDLSDFIGNEINPFLSIPLDKKMDLSIDDYSKKLINLADGYAAIADDRLVGVVAAYIRNRYENNRIFLSIYGVAQNYRNRGVGAELLNKLLNEIPKNVTLYTTVDEKNQAARRAYGKAGFIEKEIINERIHIEANQSCYS
jgi:ribosomal protein S18 acetylase RimI-like enzyme